MKKPLFFLVAALLAIVLPGCYPGNPGILVRASGAPTILLDLIPGVIDDAQFYVGNRSKLYLSVLILNEKFDIDPDSGIYDHWSHEFYNSNLPIVVCGFSDRGRHDLVDRKEVVANIGIEYASFWTVESVNRDMYLVDRGYYPKRIYGFGFRPDIKKAKIVNIPTIKTESTTVVEFINGLPSDVIVFEAGPMRSDLAMPGITRSAYKDIVKSREGKIGPGGCLLFYTNNPIVYGESAMYWVKVGQSREDDPIIVSVEPNANQGPRAVQYLIQ